MASCEDDRMEDQDDHQESHSHSLSRLATCNRNSILDYENFENYGDDNGLNTMVSRLSIESFDVGGDADEEFSDGNFGTGGGQEESSLRGCLFSDSDDDKAPAGASYSLPSTPLQQQRYQNDTLFGKLNETETKRYASDNNGQKLRRRRRKRVLRRKKWEERKSIKDMNTEEDEDSVVMKMEIGGGERGWSHCYNNTNSFSGESENGGGLRVITRPKGGGRSLCMDMEEVKACRDLGFELEHEMMFDLTTMSSGLTISASTLDTTTISSGGSSPIPNWRISSPGDDPKDVKARLKVWAQAVAIASTSRPGGS